MFFRSEMAVLAALCLITPACQTSSDSVPTDLDPEERWMEIVAFQFAEAVQVHAPLHKLFAGTPLRVQVEPRTNSLLLAGRPSEVAAAKELIGRLDVEIVADDSRGDVEVIFLENSSAAMIHESLEGVMSNSPSEISIDKRTNSLLVRAFPDEMVRIKELVAQLDRKQ